MKPLKHVEPQCSLSLAVYTMYSIKNLLRERCMFTLNLGVHFWMWLSWCSLLERFLKTQPQVQDDKTLQKRFVRHSIEMNGNHGKLGPECHWDGCDSLSPQLLLSPILTSPNPSLETSQNQGWHSSDLQEILPSSKPMSVDPPWAFHLSVFSDSYYPFPEQATSFDITGIPADMAKRIRSSIRQT